MTDDYLNLQAFSWRQKNNATLGFIWEIHSSLCQSNLFDFTALLPEPNNQIKATTEYREEMRPKLTIYRYFHRENKRDRGCCYTNDRNNVPDQMNVLIDEVIKIVKNRTNFSKDKNLFIDFHVWRGD